MLLQFQCLNDLAHHLGRVVRFAQKSWKKSLLVEIKLVCCVDPFIGLWEGGGERSKGSGGESVTVSLLLGGNPEGKLYLKEGETMREEEFLSCNC